MSKLTDFQLPPGTRPWVPPEGMGLLEAISREETIQNDPPCILLDPVWYEGQTIFEMANGDIVWKNNTYKPKWERLFPEARTVEENKEKQIVKVNIARDAFIHKAKLIGVALAIYTPILTGILFLINRWIA